MGLFGAKKLIDQVDLEQLRPDQAQLELVTKALDTYLAQYNQYKKALSEVNGKLEEAAAYQERIALTTEDTSKTVESFWATLLNFTRFKGRNKNDYNTELLQKERQLLEQFWSNKQSAVAPELSRQLTSLVMIQQKKLNDFLEQYETLKNTDECSEVADAIIAPVNELTIKASAVPAPSAARHLAIDVRLLQYEKLEKRQQRKYRTEAAYAKAFREQGAL